MARAVLFYKRLVALGGAEVLLAQHYSHLKMTGEAPIVICFEREDMERIDIDWDDLITVPGRSLFVRTFNLARMLSEWRGSLFYCHSGHIEFGLAACLARIPYGVFLHQPTTMSFNETDKFAVRYWSRYKAFARHDAMFDSLCLKHAAMSLLKRLYVNLRAVISQAILKRASALFVLSSYAVREKAEIFGLNTTYLAGAIPTERVTAMASKSSVRKIAKQISLVSVSRLDRNKRIEILIEAIAELRRRGLEANLKLGGRGPAMKELKELACNLGVEDIVHFLGYVPESDIPALYADMDLFVTIDWADYRITTYEALAENRRVIVSDDTDADSELLESGYLFTSHPDVTALADVVEKALATPLRWESGHLADYLTGFTWPVYFDRITEILRARNA